MSNWGKVGDWIKQNAGAGSALVGSLLTGNVPQAVAAGVALVSGATGTTDPQQALHALQTDPATRARLAELEHENRADVRRHIEAMALVEAEHHATAQETIRAGDSSADEYVRHTRPRMARQSWFATVAYCFAALAAQVIGSESVFDIYVAGILSAPAWAYLGLRTGDKFATALKTKAGSRK